MNRIWPRMAPLLLDIEPLAAGIAGVLLLVLVAALAD